MKAQARKSLSNILHCRCLFTLKLGRVKHTHTITRMHTETRYTHTHKHTHTYTQLVLITIPLKGPRKYRSPTNEQDLEQMWLQKSSSTPQFSLFRSDSDGDYNDDHHNPADQGHDIQDLGCPGCLFGCGILSDGIGVAHL